MRLKIDFLLEGKRNILPFNYSYKLAAVILGAIYKSNKELADSIHNGGRYKYLTFSQIQIPKREIAGDRIRILSEKVYFYVSSPSRNILNSVVEGFLTDPMVQIDHTFFRVEKVKIYNTPKFGRGKYLFSTLSPIVLRVMRTINGEKQPRYLYVTDDEFMDRLKENLLRKYAVYYGEEPADKSFRILRVYSFKPVAFEVKGTYHRGNKIVFSATGSPELLKFAYESGLGEKTAMGFGMIKLMRRIKRRRREEYARVLASKW